MKAKKFCYFESLAKMSSFALEEANLLKSFLDNFDTSRIKETKESMHALEHACDMEKHELTTALVKDFLPPIERDDLFRLAHVTDNLTDAIDKVTSYFYMADIKKLRKDVVQIAELIITACQNVVEMMKEFKNFKKSDKLKDYIILLNDIEESGDKFYAEAARNLSLEVESARDLFEWRDIYRYFEDCLDAAESVADNIESIILKNS